MMGAAHVPGVIAGGHPETLRAAATVLEAGGNAFDAAVAAGFAAGVAEPALTSLGGGGFLLARTAAGDERLFDFFVDAPGRGLAEGARPGVHPVTVQFPGTTQIFNVGAGSIAVPGCVRGYLEAHRKLGRLEPAQVLAPAIALARAGVILNDYQAYVLELLSPILASFEGSRRLFAAPGGDRLLRAGERFRNEDGAAFLEQLARDGEATFHGGALAEQVERDMRAAGGMLTSADLRAYRVIERQPLAIEYHGYRILTNPPPSSGGALIALSLELLAAEPVREWGSAAYLEQHARVMIEVERRRETSVTGSAAAGNHAVPGSTGNTTHLNVSDGEGNVASMTTSNGEGSGYVVPGTGILLNNMMGEDDLHPGGFHRMTAGTRVSSMMAPTIVIRDGRVACALGSGGSKRIRTAIVQVIRAIIDHGMDVEAAVTAPRMHWEGDAVQLEPGFDAAAIASLAQHHTVNTWSERNMYFGGAHAIDAVHGAGAGDPRRGGCALVVGAG